MQLITALVPPPAPIQTPSLVQSPPPALSIPENTPPQPHITVDNHEVSDPESDNEAPALQLEIDEQSDDEDERQAHALLRMAPISPIVTPVQQAPSTATHHGDHDFTVRISMLIT